MEFANGGELFDYIVAKKKLSEIEAKRIYYQIISGIEYIHTINIVHRSFIHFNHYKIIKKIKGFKA